MTKGIEEYRESKARTAGGLESAPSATLEAESTLQSLVSSLTNPNFSLDELPRLMKMYMLSLRMLGIDDKWASKEVKGYSVGEKVPNYRKEYCDIQYIEAKSGKLVRKTRELGKFDNSIDFLVSHRKGNWWIEVGSSNKLVAGKSVAVKKRMVPDQWDIDVVLEQIAGELFDRATKTLITARFGSAIDTIFRDYQKAVGGTLSSLDIENHLDAAYRNLKGGSEADWRAAALACRNVLQDLSEKLWCVECDEYNISGKSMSVKKDKPRNRLRAYMHEKGIKKGSIPGALLDPLYAQASAAKRRCSYENARSVLIVSYLFLAELIRQTDMETVTEIGKGSSKSKK